MLSLDMTRGLCIILYIMLKHSLTTALTTDSVQCAEQIYHKYPLAHRSATRQQAPAGTQKVLLRVLERSEDRQFGLHLAT